MILKERLDEYSSQRVGVPANEVNLIVRETRGFVAKELPASGGRDQNGGSFVEPTASVWNKRLVSVHSLRSEPVWSSLSEG